MYFIFGSDDFVLIADAPDNVTTAAMIMLVAASGTVTANTTVILTPAEVDAAAKMAISYQPAGK